IEGFSHKQAKVPTQMHTDSSAWTHIHTDTSRACLYKKKTFEALYLSSLSLSLSHARTHTHTHIYTHTHAHTHTHKTHTASLSHTHTLTVFSMGLTCTNKLVTKTVTSLFVHVKPIENTRR